MTRLGQNRNLLPPGNPSIGTVAPKWAQGIGSSPTHPPLPGDNQPGQGGKLSDAPSQGGLSKDRPALVDICIVFDTTGSMSDKIKGLIKCMAGFVQELGRLSLDWRISVLPFGDLTVPGDRVEGGWPFVSTVDLAIIQLRRMPRFFGGANVGESSIEAVMAAVGKPWRTGAVRIVVLLTDEPALGTARSNALIGNLKANQIITFVASPSLDYYKAWAKQTGGKWFKIGRSMSTRELLALLRSLVKDIAKVAAEVYTEADGSYDTYMRMSVKRRP